MDIKKLITSWHVWVMIVVIGGIFLLGREDVPAILPFVLILLCPLMMLFMMNDKHHRH